MLFFLRIFGKRSIRIPIYILAMIVTGWAVSVVSFKADLRSSKRLLSFVQLGFYNYFSMQPRSRLRKCILTSHIVPRMMFFLKASTELIIPQWDRSTNPTCSVNVYAFFIGNAIPNIITDWSLLILPIPYVWRLHQRRAQKVALCGVFGLGGL